MHRPWALSPRSEVSPPSTGLQLTNARLFEHSPRQHKIRRSETFSKAPVNEANEIMGSSGLTPINPKPRKLQSCPQFERKGGLLPCQSHRLLETLQRPITLFGFPTHQSHAFRQKQGWKVKRPLQSKLRCYRAVDESQRFRALVLFCQTDRQFGYKICHKHFVSLSPQLLQTVPQMPYAVRRSADANQIASPKSRGDRTKWLQRILLRSDLERGEPPFDLL
ncbi:hypothetical protein ACVWWO_000202 [Bradyrhizobium sp. F1.13.1]